MLCVLNDKCLTTLVTRLCNYHECIASGVFLSAIDVIMRSNLLRRNLIKSIASYHHHYAVINIMYWAVKIHKARSRNTIKHKLECERGPVVCRRQ